MRRGGERERGHVGQRVRAIEGQSRVRHKGQRDAPGDEHLRLVVGGGQREQPAVGLDVQRPQEREAGAEKLGAVARPPRRRCGRGRAEQERLGKPHR